MDLVYGSALWYSATKVNCHHLTERLAGTEQVLFVESVGARLPRAHEWRRVTARVTRSLRPLRKVQDGLWVFSPLPLPLYKRLGARLNSRWVGWQVNALLKICGWRPEVSWIFHPMGLATARSVRAKGLVYYCVDHYAANPGVDAPTIDRMERHLCQEADVTIVTGEPLADRLRRSAKRICILPNVADTFVFTRPTDGMSDPVLSRVRNLPKPRIGYVGNLAAYKIDLDLVFAIAKRRPQWSLLLVGPRDQGDIRSAINSESGPENVHFLDSVPYEHVPAVIDAFDVCILPAAEHDVMSASFPLKFFEYLLRGRPVVARGLPALRPYQSWFEQAETPEEFVSAIQKCLENEMPQLQHSRKQFAETYSWSARMQHLRGLRQEILIDPGVPSAGPGQDS